MLFCVNHFTRSCTTPRRTALKNSEVNWEYESGIAYFMNHILLTGEHIPKERKFKNVNAHLLFLVVYIISEKLSFGFKG
jgi:hypothetical protein